MSFDTNNLPSMDEIWGWHEELVAMCPRYTGNQAHKRFTDWLWTSSITFPGLASKSSG